MKREAPAVARNREVIRAVLAKELPESGYVLEVASGTGEHAVHFAEAFPLIQWQPSDPDAEAVQSIAAWRADFPGENLLEPITLDASAGEWPVTSADAIFCCNMVHISPLAASEGLFAAAGRLLAKGAPLILYGPYLEDDVVTTQSNWDFDAWLKEKNPEFGLRNTKWADEMARANGLSRSARHEMPANNLILVYRKD